MTSLLKQFKKLDIFGISISFNYEGEDTHKTYIGACLTIITLIFSAIYGYTRMEVMINREGDSNEEDIVFNYYDSDKVFSLNDMRLGDEIFFHTFVPPQAPAEIKVSDLIEPRATQRTFETSKTNDVHIEVS